MTVSISPLWIGIAHLDTDGNLLAAGQIHTYVAGSLSVEQAVYADAAGTVPCSNPIVLDSSGRCPEFYLVDGESYQFTLTRPDGTTMVCSPVDNIIGVIPIASNGGTINPIWNVISGSITYVNTTNFLITGDFLATFAVGNRVRAHKNSGYVYGTVTASSFTDPDTAVTVLFDSSSIDPSIDEVAWSSNTVDKAVDAAGVSWTPSNGYSGNSIGVPITNLISSVASLGASIQNTYKVLPTTGTPAFTVTADAGITSYSIGQVFDVLFSSSASGSCSLNVNSLGAVSIKQYDSSASLVNPTIPSGMVAHMVFDGTNFILTTPLPQPAGDVTLANFTGVNQSLTNPGHQTFPGGYQVKTGSFHCPGGGSYLNVNFDTAFPNACLGAVVSTADASKICAMNSFTNSYVRIQNGGGTGYYFAWGH